MKISGMSVNMGMALKSPQPLDARSVVSSINDLNALVSNKYAYKGMVVYVTSEADKGLYVCEDVEENTWTKVGSDIGPAVSPDDLENYYTKDDIDDLLEDKADSSDINNATLTMQLNGSSVGTFTANASENKTVNIQALPNFSLNINHNTGGNPRQVKFLTVNYANYTSSSSAYFKLSATSCHGNGSSYQFLEDIVIGVAYNSADASSVATIVCNVFKYCQVSCGTESYNLVDELERYYGDVFYVHDSTNKIVDFYILCGQYASSQFTPITKIGSTTTSGITQHTGTATYHESGTRNWANGNATVYAVKSDLDSYIPKTGFSMRNSSTALKFYYKIDGKETAVTLKSPTIPSSTSQLTNDSGFVTKADAAPEIIDLTE